jgi:hypothetical protein
LERKKRLSVLGFVFYSSYIAAQYNVIQAVLSQKQQKTKYTTKNYAITPGIFEIFLGVNFNISFTKK